METTFGVAEIEGHIWTDLYKKPLYCVGVVDSDGEIEPFADDYIAEVAEITIEDYVGKMEEITDDRFSYAYVSDNTMLRETDTYFLKKEDAQKLADYLNGIDD